MSRHIDFRGFLADECCTVLGASVRGFKVFTYSDVGLGRGTKDPKVLEHARDHGAIVITRNGSDFAQLRKLPRASQPRVNARQCGARMASDL